MTILPPHRPPVWLLRNEAHGSRGATDQDSKPTGVLQAAIDTRRLLDYPQQIARKFDHPVLLVLLKIEFLPG